MDTYENKYKSLVEAVKTLKEANPSDEGIQNWVKDNVPELKESEDEKIRKELVQFFKEKDEEDFEEWIPKAKVLSWFEKQCGQKPVPDWMPKFLDELRSKKNYFDWDEHRDIEGGILTIIKWMKPNYFNGKDGEQKPTDKVEPRFKAGDFVRSKYNKAVVLKIEEVCNDIYKTECGGYIRIEFQDDWELMEEKSAWSEEDETMFVNLVAFLEGKVGVFVGGAKKYAEWLKERYKYAFPMPHWKPSGEQIAALKFVIESLDNMFTAIGYMDNYTKPHLEEILEALKKLRGE